MLSFAWLQLLPSWLHTLSVSTDRAVNVYLNIAQISDFLLKSPEQPYSIVHPLCIWKTVLGAHLNPCFNSPQKACHILWMTNTHSVCFGKYLPFSTLSILNKERICLFWMIPSSLKIQSCQWAEWKALRWLWKWACNPVDELKEVGSKLNYH